jgi:hypothetical protein
MKMLKDGILDKRKIVLTLILTVKEARRVLSYRELTELEEVAGSEE